MRAIRSQIRRSWRAGPVRHGGPAAVGFIPKLKIAVGRYSEHHALGISTMPLILPSIAAESSKQVPAHRNSRTY